MNPVHIFTPNLFSFFYLAFTTIARFSLLILEVS
jgi:hypothetical protein